MSSEKLKLKNQLCFPLYACSREIVKKYTPLLKDLKLTYTQYITMMVLWEHGTVTVKALGEALYLDSGTLTPLLKNLEKEGYVRRERNPEDERSLLVHITEKGAALEEKAENIPEALSRCVDLSAEDGYALYHLLYKLLHQLDN